MKISKDSDLGRRSPWRLDGYYGGRRVRRYFRTRQLAEAELRRLSEERRETGASADRLSPRERIVLAELRDEVEAAGGTMEEAVAFWLEFAAPPRRPLRMVDLLEEALEAKGREGRSDRYLVQLRSAVGQFCRWRGMGLRWSHEVSGEMVMEWAEGNGWSAKTRRNYLIDVRTVLEFGKKVGAVRMNALEGVALPPGSGEGEVAVLSVREAARLVALARPGRARGGGGGRDGLLLGYVTLGLFAGLRPERELGLLRLGDLDLESGSVVVSAGSAKSRSRRVVDLSPNAVGLLGVAREVLVGYWRGRGFRGEEGEMALVPRNFRRRWEVLRAAAGLLEGWTPDVMRHSYASYHLAMWENENRLKAQMGHAAGSEMLWQHYRARVTRRAAERFWRMGGNHGAARAGATGEGE